MLGCLQLLAKQVLTTEVRVVQGLLHVQTLEHQLLSLLSNAAAAEASEMPAAAVQEVRTG